ncbi:MAG: hypothetical protein ACI8RZ_007890 [Myxococcota bacterium]|jgi:hypothetical protein
MFLIFLLGCSEKFDAATDSGISWPDDDGDGYTADVDCDDADPEVHPDAVEVCDGINNDCDAAIDETDSVDATAWYMDSDGDGFGASDISTLSCDRPPGFVADGTDCDDDFETSYPGAEEICNDFTDNDCDGDASDCVLIGTFSLAHETVITGASSADEAGGVLVGGDFNGDGQDDLLIGAAAASTDDSDAGIAFIVYGPLSGGSLSSAGAALSGNSRSDSAGFAAVSPGDVDGDGIDDMLIAAPGDDEARIDAGSVYLLLGPTSGNLTLSDVADGVLYGEGTYDRAGEAVAGPGDVTGDGGLDLIVAATRYGDNDYTYQGAVYVVPADDVLAAGSTDLSKATARILGVSRYDRVGSALSGGDMDGDGIVDLLVGAYSAPENDGLGQVSVFLGPITGELSVSDADTLLSGVDDDDYAGFSLSVGDIDADGSADLCIGAPFADGDEEESGVVYVIRGAPGSADLSAAHAILTGGSDGDEAGTAVACDGDFNGDGHMDIFVGAPNETTGGNESGTSYLLYGPVTGALSLSTADVILTGAESRQSAGTALTAALDANGDGFADAIIGAPEDNSGGTDAGAVYIVFGVGL